MSAARKATTILTIATLLAMGLPVTAAYHGDGPPASVDPAGGRYVVGVVPADKQEEPGDPTVALGGDNDLAEANGYAAPPSDGGGLQNLRSDAQYWCGSGYPVGRVVDGRVVAGADPGNQTGPVGHYEIDAMWVHHTVATSPQAVDDHLIARETGDPDGDFAAPYYYGATVFAASEEKPTTMTPGLKALVVHITCAGQPTALLPQNYTFTEQADGAWVRAPTGAVRGLFGYDDVFSWTSNSRFGEDFRTWTFMGDCDDTSVIWDPEKTKTCDAFPGAQVIDSAWYDTGLYGYRWEATTTPRYFRFVVNPAGTIRFPGYYNSLYQNPDVQCFFGEGDAFFGNCGDEFYVTQTRYPEVAKSTGRPAPVLEDVDIYTPPGGDTSTALIFEAWATGYRVPRDCLTSPTCRVTGGAAPSATPAREFEPNHPEDPEERSALDASLNPTQNVSKGGWGLYLDVYKWTYAYAAFLNFDPIYGVSGGNYTTGCSYTNDRPNQPGPGEPCNRRDVYPTGFSLEAMFGFARDHAANAAPDGEIDQRLGTEWIGFPDLTRDQATFEPMNVADVGLVGDGNAIAIDTPSGKVLQLKGSCALTVDNNVGTGNQNMHQPATTDTANSEGVTANVGPASFAETTVLDVSYGTPVPASREDVAACNPRGDASAGWGTFVGCEDPLWERACAGMYSSSIVYVAPDGNAGLVRTKVAARLIVPDGGLQFKGAKEHPLASVLQPGTYELTDVDYYGGKI